MVQLAHGCTQLVPRLEPTDPKVEVALQFLNINNCPTESKFFVKQEKIDKHCFVVAQIMPDSHHHALSSPKPESLGHKLRLRKELMKIRGAGSPTRSHDGNLSFTSADSVLSASVSPTNNLLVQVGSGTLPT